VQQAEPQRAARIALGVRVLVRRPLGVAVEMKVRTGGVRVHVQMPLAGRVTQDHGPAEPDQQQRDQEVGRRPEAVGRCSPNRMIAPTTRPTLAV